MKKFSSLFLLGVLIISFTNLVSASCPMTGKPEITSLSSISNFMTQFTSNFFNGVCWAEHALDAIIFFIVPIIFLIVLLKAIMDEINIFNGKVTWALSICIAIMAIPMGIYSGLLTVMANIGAIFATVVFFAVVFVIGLSKWYRKKAKEYDFLMGNRFLTVLVVHSPLIVLFTLTGIWLGTIKLGTNYLFQFAAEGIQTGSSGMISLYALSFIAIITAVLLLVLKEGRKNWKGVIMVGILAGIATIVFSNLSVGDLKAQSSTLGAVFGFMIGMGFALLEWGRKHSLKIKAIDDQAKEGLDGIQRNIEQAKSDLKIAKKNLESATGEAAVGYRDQIIYIEKRLEDLKYSRQELLDTANAAAMKKIWNK